MDRFENVKIFVAAHKPFENSGKLPKEYLPIQVGAKGKDGIGFIRDDTGDSISEKNGSYCELTGLYWLWKNSDADVVGLCHYRRYLSSRPLDRKLRSMLGAEKILEILKKRDIILPKKVNLGRKNVYEHYCAAHYEKDLLTTRKAIETLYPEFLEDFDAVMKEKKTYQCNMFIAKKSLADEYCKWLFDVLAFVEENTDISEYDRVQARIYGYLGERLINVWVRHKKLSVCEKWFASTELTFKAVKTAIGDKLHK